MMVENQKYQAPIRDSIVIDFLIMFSVFISSIVLFKEPFEFYIHYVIFLALLPFFAVRFGFPKYAAQILLITLIIGGYNVFISNSESFMFIKTWGGLTLSVTFYSYVLQYYNFDLKKIFEKYLKWSYWMAIICGIQAVSFIIKFKPGYDYSWILNKWSAVPGGLVGLRLNGLFSEPAQLAAVLAPAVYVAFYNIIHKEKFVLNKLQSLIILGAYFGSASSTAYIGLLLIIIFVTDTLRVRYIVFGAVFIAFMATLLYNNVPDFRSRVDTSYELWVNNNYSIENTNTSGFVLYNNSHVAANAFVEHPIFGTGLGSYKNSFEKYSLTKSILEYDFEFNVSDGNSLFLRMVVETGLLGIGFFLLVLFRGFVGKSATGEARYFRLISQSILIMILLYLLRQGNYFLNALPMFVMMYYFNWKQFKVYQSEKEMIEENEEMEKNKNVSQLISVQN
jgi:O-antigen ligase